jgi:hypothetical protein
MVMTPINKQVAGLRQVLDHCSPAVAAQKEDLMRRKEDTDASGVTAARVADVRPQTGTKRLSPTATPATSCSRCEEGNRPSRLPHCLDSRLIDGGKVVSFTRLPVALYSQEDSSY